LSEEDKWLLRKEDKASLNGLRQNGRANAYSLKGHTCLPMPNSSPFFFELVVTALQRYKWGWIS
jgi:hypothetical protein